MKLLINTLKVVMFSRKLSNFHWLFSFPVTDFLNRNEYSFVPLLFVILISLPLQYFYKYDGDYPSDDKTRQTLPKYIFLIVSRDDAQEFRQENRTKITITRSEDQSAKCFSLVHVFPVNHIITVCQSYDHD